MQQLVTIMRKAELMFKSLILKVRRSCIADKPVWRRRVLRKQLEHDRQSPWLTAGSQVSMLPKHLLTLTYPKQRYTDIPYFVRASALHFIDNIEWTSSSKEMTAGDEGQRGMGEDKVDQQWLKLYGGYNNCSILGAKCRYCEAYHEASLLNES